MSDSDAVKETAVSDVEKIDALKEEEKTKLGAAEMAYSDRQAANVSAPASAEPQENNRGEKKMAWLPGVILIGLGVIFLLNNTTGIRIDNWWALFIMIPAVGSFSKAADAIRGEGEFTRDAWGALALGVTLSLVASAFLFNLDWSLIWPAFLIIGGLGMFLGAWKSW